MGRLFPAAPGGARNLGNQRRQAMVVRYIIPEALLRMSWIWIWPLAQTTQCHAIRDAHSQMHELLKTLQHLLTTSRRFSYQVLPWRGPTQDDCSICYSLNPATKKTGCHSHVKQVSVLQRHRRMATMPGVRHENLENLESMYIHTSFAK